LRFANMPCQSGQPLVSLGLPVYNGENYLRQALDSILAQTYPCWELIISDNGSTDSTRDICREYAGRDGRVRYYREQINRGATWNFNRVFELARGPLFRWTAHDDLCDPDLIGRCVAALIARPEAVLCHPRTRVIGPSGQLMYDDPVRLRTDSPRPSDRFADLILLDHACYQIFGVIRSEALRRAPPFGGFVGADRNLLAELSLLGPFHEIPEHLFFRRDHPNTSTRRFPNAVERMAWFRNGHGGRFPTLRRALEYGASLMRAPLDPFERMACLGHLGRWMGRRARSAMGHSAAALRLHAGRTVTAAAVAGAGKAAPT
jgi:glycosyltransferase involved in cell wall biosynthesis